VPEYIPEIILPGGFDSGGEYLRKLVKDGIKKCYKENRDIAKKRADYELDIIVKTGNVPLYLYVYDYVSYARQKSVRMGFGRSAAPSSLVCYALGLTGVDPLRFGLVFDRFINPELNERPEIIVEFSDDWRSKIHKYVREKYGDRCAAEWDMENPGLPVLDDIQKAEVRVRNKGREYRKFFIDKIPPRDHDTFTLFGEGDTDGVYHFDSDKIKKFLFDAKPDSITDLASILAISHAAHFNLYEFVDRKSGEHPNVYRDVCMKDILASTYGMIIFQEQVILLIRRLSGCSLARADVIRRTLCKNDPNLTEEERAAFIAAARGKGFKETVAGDIFDDIAAAAPHTFLKSHAVACSLLAYQTAYLKTCYPEEYVYDARER
jgi:DNA polymerase III alpha subunit